MHRIIVFVLCFSLSLGINVFITRVKHPYKTEARSVLIFGSSDSDRPQALCADHVDVNTAIVICRSVGLGQFNTSFPPLFGDFIMRAETGQFWVNKFVCHGTETHVRNCPLDFLPGPPCHSGHDAVIDCSLTDDRKKYLKTTLVGSDNKDQGIVKLHSEAYPTIVGKVCLETGSWGVNEAKVVCRSLGYDVDKDIVATPVSKNVLSMFPNSDPNLKYVIKNVKCQGTETSMSDCYHTEMCKLEKNGDFICETTCNGQNVGVICATSNKPGSCDTLV